MPGTAKFCVRPVFFFKVLTRTCFFFKLETFCNILETGKIGKLFVCLSVVGIVVTSWNCFFLPAFLMLFLLIDLRLQFGILQQTQF